MPLRGVWVLTLSVNLPGPVAASRLCAMGASVVKIEPPGGDPLARMCPGYYQDLSAGQKVVRLDLKDQQERASLDDRLEGTDLLLTANRPAALGRLGLSWTELHARFPRLCQVAIVGHPPPDEDVPGHDLTYQARFGTLSPPGMPPVLVADLAGAERAVSAALSLLFARERGQGAGYEQVALSEAARTFAGPLHQGLTTPDGVLGGAFPLTVCTAPGMATWRSPPSNRTSGNGCRRNSGWKAKVVKTWNGSSRRRPPNNGRSGRRITTSHLLQ